MLAMVASPLCPPTLSFRYDGAELAARLAGDAVAAVLRALAGTPARQAGVRLTGAPALSSLLPAQAAVGSIAGCQLGSRARPVRAILFDKTAATNWALGWHQDRTIAERRRVDVPGYGPWTVKAGMLHVAPPVALLEQMVTLRVHLDAVGQDNAPLLVAPGSHRLGLVPEREVAGVVQRCGTVACLAQTGDVWAYSTLILHASEAAARPGRRRVLQVDYSADSLPGGLQWLGV